MRALPDVKFNFKLRDLMQRPTIAGLLGLEVPAFTQSNALLALNRTNVRKPYGHYSASMRDWEPFLIISPWPGNSRISELSTGFPAGCWAIPHTGMTRLSRWRKTIRKSSGACSRRGLIT